MTVLGINGSPRKTWNTATLLEMVLEGAASRGAETGLVHQFADYSKVVFGCSDPEDRRERRRAVFPRDCETAFALGARLAAPR